MILEQQNLTYERGGFHLIREHIFWEYGLTKREETHLEGQNY